MLIDQAEQLKDEFTDKYVVVANGVPELKRFAGLTGLVKTVNMNGHALVEFNGPADIGWYDIETSYLTVVDKPVEKSKAAAPAKEAAKEKPAKKAAASKGASPLELARQQGAAGAGDKPKDKKPAAGLSPLELARQQGAAQSGGVAESTAPAKADAPKPAAKEKLSPLELARQQGAFKGEGQSAAAEPESKPAPAESGEKLSPLELARQQGAFKGGDQANAAEEETAGESASDAASPEKKETPTTGPDGQPLSIIELARLQGPFKG